jgi:hypothetical protein
MMPHLQYQRVGRMISLPNTSYSEGVFPTHKAGLLGLQKVSNG